MSVPRICPTVGLGSSNPTTLKEIQRVQKTDAWMENFILSTLISSEQVLPCDLGDEFMDSSCSFWSMVDNKQIYNHLVVFYQL